MSVGQRCGISTCVGLFIRFVNIQCTGTSFHTNLTFLSCCGHIYISLKTFYVECLYSRFTPPNPFFCNFIAVWSQPRGQTMPELNWCPKPLLFTLWECSWNTIDSMHSPVRGQFKKVYSGLDSVCTYFISVKHVCMQCRTEDGWHTSLFVWLCAMSGWETHLPLHSFLHQISMHKVGFHAEMVFLCIKNIFEHFNVPQDEYYSVQMSTNNFIDILWTYVNSPAGTSSPFTLKRFQ